MNLANDLLKQFTLSQSVVTNTSNLLYGEYEKVLQLVNAYLLKNEIRTKTELRALIRQFTSESFDDSEFTQEVVEFGGVQAEQYKETIKNYVTSAALTSIAATKLNKKKIRKAVMNTYINNATVSEALRTMSATSKNFFKQEMINAYVNSETVDDITKNITSRLKYVDKKIKQHTITQTRTILNGVSNAMLVETVNQNDDIMEGWQVLVTLDSKTSPPCRAYGATPEKVYPLDKPPSLPAHYNCRSVLIPVIKDEYDKQFTSSETRPAKFYDKEGKLVKVEQVSTKLSFDDFLKQNPVAFQKDVLRPVEYKIFKQGVSLNRFVDNGRVLSVAELRSKFRELL
ncbi:hypothetical protein [Candidatus Francisella endociliophora]|uniref:hypothetical protein n=1 Tax=Candidatus Francisella endociliophora TaxID=653937 RepID=UPI0006932F27|nr:hypothetical protein [Francisella sp. FSC1006]